MSGVIKERQITEAQQEQLELEELAPEKFDPEIEFKVNKHASNNRDEIRYGTYTMAEVAALLAASKAPPKATETSSLSMKDYPTLSREEASRLVREHYEYKERERQRLREREWDSAKMTEFVEKTKSTTKPTSSTKPSKKQATTTLLSFDTLNLPNQTPPTHSETRFTIR